MFHNSASFTHPKKFHPLGGLSGPLFRGQEASVWAVRLKLARRELLIQHVTINNPHVGTFYIWTIQLDSFNETFAHHANSLSQLCQPVMELVGFVMKQANKQASKHTNKQAHTQARTQARKQESKQASKQTNTQRSKQTSKEANKQANRKSSK